MAVNSVYCDGCDPAIDFQTICEKTAAEISSNEYCGWNGRKKGTILNDQRVKVDGQSWKYVANAKVDVGDLVKVVALNGVTLKVQKIKDREE